MLVLRECRECGTFAKNKDDLHIFVSNKRCPYGKANICKECSVKYAKDYRKTSPDKITNYKTKLTNDEYKRRNKNSNLKKLYGISLDDYEYMFSEQNGKCKICENDFPSEFHTHVDHCHTTGKVRGLLCNGCNMGLGRFKDDVKILENAINYLMEDENE